MRPSAIPRFLHAGETALVVEFGTRIDPAIHARVLAFDRAVQTAQIDAILETVPTYRSLMIHYDPTLIEPQALIGQLQGLPSHAGERDEPRRRWIVPVCYAPGFAEDLETVATQLRLPLERIVALHAGATYRLYMYGFAPGWAYLGGLPVELNISRRAKPRSPTTANSILIAGGQALVATMPMPTGWYVLGRTPERLFSLARDPVFLAAVGDELKFEPIDQSVFAELEERAIRGEIVARQEFAS